MIEFNVTIQGTADLLQNAFEAVGDPKSFVVGGAAKDYSDEWLKKLYLLDDGTLYQPEAHLIGTLIKAATQYKIPGHRGKTYKDTVKGGVFIEPACIPHGVNVTDFENGPVQTGPAVDNVDYIAYVDRRPVRVQRARVIRYRPALVKGWTLSFRLQALDDEFQPDAIKAIIDTAGREVGIGDYRPRFGRFIVTQFEAAN